MRIAMATKFVAWEVPTLEALKGSKVYNLREKLNNGRQMNREEKAGTTDKHHRCRNPTDMRQKEGSQQGCGSQELQEVPRPLQEIPPIFCSTCSTVRPSTSFGIA